MVPRGTDSKAGARRYASWGSAHGGRPVELRAACGQAGRCCQLQLQLVLLHRVKPLLARVHLDEAGQQGNGRGNEEQQCVEG